GCRQNALTGSCLRICMAESGVCSTRHRFLPLQGCYRSVTKYICDRSVTRQRAEVTRQGDPAEANTREGTTIMNILHVTSSPRGSASYSNRVAANVLDELRARDPGATVTVRHLAQHPLPYIGDDFVTATRSANGP